MEEYFKRLYTKTDKEFYEELEEAIKKKKKMFIVTANPETFMLSNKEVEIKKILSDNNTVIVSDGIGVVKAAEILDCPVSMRIPGIDIAWKLLELASKYQKKVYLLGAKKEVIDALNEKIRVDYPGINLVGSCDGYVADKDMIFDDMKKKKPDVVMVALGIPAQEKLIYKHIEEFKHGIFIGVGGSFDVISGMKKRAPKLFQKLGLEWCYRLIKEPKRIKRFYNSNVKFIFEVKKIKKRSRKEESV